MSIEEGKKFAKHLTETAFKSTDVRTDELEGALWFFTNQQATLVTNMTRVIVKVEVLEEQVKELKNDSESSSSLDEVELRSNRGRLVALTHRVEQVEQKQDDFQKHQAQGCRNSQNYKIFIINILSLILSLILLMLKLRIDFRKIFQKLFPIFILSTFFQRNECQIDFGLVSTPDR